MVPGVRKRQHGGLPARRKFRFAVMVIADNQRVKARAWWVTRKDCVRCRLHVSTRFLPRTRLLAWRLIDAARRAGQQARFSPRTTSRVIGLPFSWSGDADTEELQVTGVTRPGRRRRALDGGPHSNVSDYKPNSAFIMLKRSATRRA